MPTQPTRNASLTGARADGFHRLALHALEEHEVAAGVGDGDGDGDARFLRASDGRGHHLLRARGREALGVGDVHGLRPPSDYINACPFRTSSTSWSRPTTSTPRAIGMRAF